MHRGKRDNDLVLRIKELRKEIGSRVREELQKEYDEARKEGRFPWGGLWLTRREIAWAIKKIRIRDKIVFLEVLALFLLLVFVSWIFFRVLVLLLLPG